MQTYLRIYLQIHMRINMCIYTGKALLLEFY